jgi:hypothetical protein
VTSEEQGTTVHVSVRYVVHRSADIVGRSIDEEAASDVRSQRVRPCLGWAIMIMIDSGCGDFVVMETEKPPDRFTSLE